MISIANAAQSDSSFSALYDTSFVFVIIPWYPNGAVFNYIDRGCESLLTSPPTHCCDCNMSRYDSIIINQFSWVLACRPARIAFS